MNRRAHRIRSSLVRFRNAVGLTLALSAAVGLTACSSSHDDGKTASSSPRTSPSAAPTTATADPEAPEKKALLQAYGRYWHEQAKAYAQADIKGTRLKKYATKKALTRVMGDLLVMQKAGTATTGSPSHKVKVTSLTLARKIPTASLQDCLDISGWRTVMRKTGKVKPFPSKQPLRYVTTVSAEKWGKQWMITDAEPDGDRTC
ncbi:hypothetical protein [Streptomyces sp. NPDC047028]|uniref:hypothetical protein n=1 Tax=Streptomyces sp. NPDC047028 TaxID=3155793 RepID=UPI0033CB5CFD